MKQLIYELFFYNIFITLFITFPILTVLITIIVTSITKRVLVAVSIVTIFNVIVIIVFYSDIQMLMSAIYYTFISFIIALFIAPNKHKSKDSNTFK